VEESNFKDLKQYFETDEAEGGGGGGEGAYLQNEIAETCLHFFRQLTKLVFFATMRLFMNFLLPHCSEKNFFVGNW
jgi:hypothetical protein